MKVSTANFTMRVTFTVANQKNIPSKFLTAKTLSFVNNISHNMKLSIN